jgi:purine nucleosidase
MSQKIIFDCDNTFGLPFKEIDDGLALIYLLGRSDLHLLGVTTVFGNGSGEQACAQTRQLLREYARPEVPVLLGAAKMGAGITEAARFLAESAAAQPGEITLLATGPLSNLCAAAALDPAFFANLREVVCMGGYLAPLRIGWRNLAELNFSADPQAAWTLLNAACPLTVMSAQLCLEAYFGWRDLRRTRFLNNKLRRTMRNWLLAFGIYFGVAKFYLWDLLPAILISFPELFDHREVSILSTIEDLRRGALVISTDAYRWRTVKLPSHITDLARFKNVLFEAWKQAEAKGRA